MKGKPFFTITSTEFDKDRWVFDENCNRVEDVDDTIDGDKLVLTQNINYIQADKDAFYGGRAHLLKIDETGHWNFNDKNEIK